MFALNEKQKQKQPQNIQFYTISVVSKHIVLFCIQDYNPYPVLHCSYGKTLIHCYCICDKCTWCTYVSVYAFDYLHKAFCVLCIIIIKWYIRWKITVTKQFPSLFFKATRVKTLKVLKELQWWLGYEGVWNVKIWSNSELYMTTFSSFSLTPWTGTFTTGTFLSVL